MRTLFTRPLIPSLLLGASLGAAYAVNPSIIDEQTPTVPAAPYLEAVSPDIGQLVAGITPQDMDKLAQAPAEIHMQVFPVTTKGMTPGKVVNKTIQLDFLPSPVFVIGDDRRSVVWLLDHKAQLKKLNAIGIVVSVETETDFKHLQRLAKPLLLMPVSAQQIAERVGVNHYPVLITSTEVSQ